MRQLTLLMTEKLLCREAKQLASVLYSHWWSGLNLQMVFSPPRFSFHSLVTDFSCFTNEYLLPWIHLMAQGMPLSVLPEPFHSLLLLPWLWTVEATAGTEQHDPRWKSVNSSATSQLSHWLRFTVTAQSPALTLLLGHKGGPTFCTLCVWTWQAHVYQERSSMGQGCKMPTTSTGWSFASQR